MAIGISPDRMEFITDRGMPQKLNLFIENMEDNPKLIRATLSDPENFSLDSGNIHLAGNENMALGITYDGRKDATSNLILRQLPATGYETAVAAEVQIPIRAVAEGRDFTNLGLPILLAIIVSTIIFILKKFTNRAAQTPL